MKAKAKQKCALPSYIYFTRPSRNYRWDSCSMSLATQRTSIKQEIGFRICFLPAVLISMELHYWVLWDFANVFLVNFDCVCICFESVCKSVIYINGQCRCLPRWCTNDYIQNLLLQRMYLTFDLEFSGLLFEKGMQLLSVGVFTLQRPL